MSLRRRCRRALLRDGMAAQWGSNTGGDRNARRPGAHDPAAQLAVQERGGRR